MSGRTDERTDGRADGRTSGRTDERTDGRADGRTSGRTDERTDGRRAGPVEYTANRSTDCGVTQQWVTTAACLQTGSQSCVQWFCPLTCGILASNWDSFAELWL